MNLYNRPRFRMFAGPNGSGKTTLKNFIGDKYHDKFGSAFLGASINADEIEKQLKHSPLFPLSPYQVEASAIEWEDFCENSTLLRREGLIDSVKNAAYIDKHNSIDF